MDERGEPAKPTRAHAPVGLYRGAVSLLVVALGAAVALLARGDREHARAVVDLGAELAEARGAACPSARTIGPRPGLGDESGPEVTILALGERAADLARKYPDQPDVIEKFFESSELTVHMHLMGPTQRCPLHVHERTSEATVIVAGTAHVRHAYGEGGVVATREGRFPPGSVIASPARCAHEWVNPDATERLANLVFTSPKFQGNRYLAADDGRLAAGPAPTVYDPAADLAALAAGSEPSRAGSLGAMGGRMRVLLVKGDARVEAPGKRKMLVLYALRGAALLPGGQTMRERDLAMVRASGSVELHAEPGKPLAALVMVEP